MEVAEVGQGEGDSSLVYAAAATAGSTRRSKHTGSASIAIDASTAGLTGGPSDDINYGGINSCVHEPQHGSTGGEEHHAVQERVPTTADLVLDLLCVAALAKVTQPLWLAVWLPLA